MSVERLFKVFLGEHFHKLDKKGRVVFPAKYREKLREGFIVTTGFNNCISVFPLSYWPHVMEKLMNARSEEHDGRGLARKIFAKANEGESDKQGRFTLPSQLRLEAGIKEDVVINGVNTHLEIWDTKIWNDYMEEITPVVNAIKADFAELGF